MTDWYYAGFDGQRQGPLGADDIGARFRRNELTPDTLVWREGLAEWLPLHQLAAELGLDAVSATPAPSPLPSPTVSNPASPYAAPSAPMSFHAAPVTTGDVVMAGFWKRYAALAIDGLVLGAFTLVGVFVCLLLAGGAMTLNAQQMASDLAQGSLGVALIFGIYVLPIAFQAIYYSWMHASSSQATLGKLAVGIKVTRGNGEALGLGRSFGRWCAYFFLNLLTCSVASLVSAFTTGLTERKQALHDMIADTLVVDKWAFTAHPERQQRTLGTVTWVVIVLAALLVLAYIGFLLFAIGLAAMGDR